MILLSAEAAALLGVFSVLGAIIAGIIVSLGCPRHVSAVLAGLALLLSLLVLLAAHVVLR